MCGIAAIFAYRDAAPGVDRAELCRIRDFMARRGPDGAGEWFSEDGRIGLVHRRLAVIDLSEAGSQPMQSADGKIAVSFNGEIYNYRELRSELEEKGRRFYSQSDTEVLIHLYQEKGESMVQDLRGMFAFVLWDSEKKSLLLARDPYGIKPLYYADDGWSVRVASQVKALLSSEKVSKLSEPAGTASFFLMGSVLEPFTLYQEIRQVPSGSFVWVDGTGPLLPKRYFSIAEIFSQTSPSPLTLSPSGGEGVDRDRPFLSPSPLWGEGRVREVREALLDSIRHHFVSDVPVGIFLSGGIDSGSLTALAKESGVQNLQTVTLAFEEFLGTNQDEAPWAGEVARLYGTRHHTRLLSRSEFREGLEDFLESMDQPSIDGINTYFVSKAARELGLKVALSGLGGDELFGGYPSFREIPQMVSLLSIPSRIPFLGDAFRSLVHYGRGVLQYAPTHPKFAGLLKYGGSYPGAYFLKRGLFMPWELETVMDPERARAGLERLGLFDQLADALKPDPGTSFSRVAALEASFYMRNQLLRDADWAGMAHSLEIRTPFVDTWLLKNLSSTVGAYCNTPLSQPKHLLMGSLKTPLPQNVLHRPKTGFSVPIEKWLGEDETLDDWRRVPSLARKNTPWARRWAYLVMEKHQRIKTGVGTSR